MNFGVGGGVNAAVPLMASGAGLTEIEMGGSGRGLPDVVAKGFL